LCEQRVNVPEDLAVNHPTIQASKKSDGVSDHWQVGLLGLLNGVAGAHSNGWGYIAALFSDQGDFLRFVVHQSAKE